MSHSSVKDTYSFKINYVANADYVLEIEYTDLSSNLLDSTVNLLKNGFKWATGSSAKLSDINLKRDVFTKKTWSDFKLKLGDIKLAFKSGGLSTFVEYGKFMIKDFGKNFKKEFFDFTDVNGKFDWKGTLGSVKNILGVPKALLDDDLSLSSVLKVGLKNIVLPSLSAFSVNKIDTITGSGGQLKWDFTYDNISLDTIVSFGKDIWDAGVDLEGLFDNTIIGKDVISKLSEGCPLDISIPVIKIPDTNLLILRTA
ncbi:MAG: hypothetical protein IJZ35_06805 [Clostridia bacterium]|nr:hypothetical protein [Clostridia bacterium]